MQISLLTYFFQEKAEGKVENLFLETNCVFLYLIVYMFVVFRYQSCCYPCWSPHLSHLFIVCLEISKLFTIKTAYSVSYCITKAIELIFTCHLSSLQMLKSSINLLFVTTPIWITATNFLFDFFSFSHEYLFYIILLFHKKSFSLLLFIQLLQENPKNQLFFFSISQQANTPHSPSPLYTFHTHFYPSAACLLYFPFFPFIHNIIGIKLPTKKRCSLQRNGKAIAAAVVA